MIVMTYPLLQRIDRQFLYCSPPFTHISLSVCL
jgi:hypothetical protein